MRSAEDLIADIPIDQSNFLRIIAERKISGALFIGIKKAMQEYFNDRKDILPVTYHNPFRGMAESVCTKCRYFAEPIIKARFFTDTVTSKRIQFLSMNCPKCGFVIQKCEGVFYSAQHEQDQKKFLEGEGIEVNIE
jgi:RNase P subunit RPR2